MKDMLYVLNFSGHTFTTVMVGQVKRLLANQYRVKKISIRCFMELKDDFGKQIVEVVNNVGLDTNEWKDGYFVIVPPAISQAALLLMIEISERSGKMPLLVRTVRYKTGGFSKYKVAELISLEEHKSQARKRR